MTREEVVTILNSQNYNQIDLADIMLHNIAIRNSKYEPILYEEEETEIIELLYSIGAEDYFIEQREAATAFLFHKKTMDVFLSDIEAINDYLILEKAIVSGADISLKLVQATELSSELIDLFDKKMKPKEELIEVKKMMLEDTERLLAQSFISIRGFKGKVVQLKTILKHYLKGIDSFDNMIKTEEAKAKQLTKEIIKTGKWLNKAYKVKLPKELISYSKIKVSSNLDKRVSKLIYP